jgi:hypothetical protein
MEKELEASLSTLILSIASSAAIYLGLSPGPDGKIAKFNIELLRILQAKTKGNLSADEDQFLLQVLKDLQLKYVDETKK